MNALLFCQFNTYGLKISHSFTGVGSTSRCPLLVAHEILGRYFDAEKNRIDNAVSIYVLDLCRQQWKWGQE